MTSDSPEATVPPPVAEEPDDFAAMLAGAGVIFVVSLIPYASFACCLPYLVGALLAIHLFTRKYGLTLSYGRGIKLGVLTCLMGGLAVWAVATAIWLVFNYQLGQKEGESIGLFIAGKVGGPEAVKQAQEAMEAQKAQGVGAAKILLGLVSVGVFAAVSGVIGGALGAALFKRGPKAGVS